MLPSASIGSGMPCASPTYGGALSLLGLPVPAARHRALGRGRATVGEPRLHPPPAAPENLRPLAPARGGAIRQGRTDELTRGAGAGVVQVDCAAPDRAARLIDQAGIAAGTALTDTGLAVTLPAGATRELVADINRRLVLADIDVYGL